MTEEEIEKIIKKKNEMCLVMGVAATLILEMNNNIPEKWRSASKWILDSINNIVYQDKSPPPFPEM